MSEPEPQDPNLPHTDAAPSSPSAETPSQSAPSDASSESALNSSPGEPPAPVTPVAPPPVAIPAPIVPVTPPPAKTTPQRVTQKAPASNDPISRFRNKTTADDDARMGFIDHLLELRKRLWVAIVAVMVCVFLSFIFYKPIYNFLAEPIRVVDRKYTRIVTERGTPPATGHVINLTTNQPLGSMLMVIWLGFWAGLVVASPIVLYELWAFIAPGLHDKEKNAIKPVLYGGAFFFLIGAAIAYYFLAPMSFDFFVWLDIDLGLMVNWTSETCIEMLITMMIVSGLLCEIPLLVAGLARLGLVEPVWLIKYWKVFTFGSVFLGMTVSPGNDLASMSAFSGLILGIYLVSILMAYIFYRKPVDPNAPKPKDEAAPKDGIKKP